MAVLISVLAGSGGRRVARPAYEGHAGNGGRAADRNRIVSLIPAATEILFAIGAGERVVGRTRWGIHPAAARAVPDIGDGIRPALELVVARQPDLVILYAGADNAGVSQRLTALGIPTLSLKHDTLADLYSNILTLGEATGCSTSARRLQDHIRETLATVTSSVGSRRRPTVYYDVWADPPITIGRGSYLDALIETAGGLNIFHDLADPSPQVSLEAIVAREPDVILHPVSRHEKRSAPAERPGWTSVRAVSSGRVHRIDGDLAHRLGPRVAEAAYEIARALHPDVPLPDARRVEVPGQGVCQQ